MATILQIIHLDNDGFSLSLIRALLVEEGLVCDITQVETRKDFITLLERGGIDVVLADLSTPGLDGMTALAMTRKISADLPFIIVTATMDTEFVLESFKNGASDYVLKGRLSRLAPAIQLAILRGGRLSQDAFTKWLSSNNRIDTPQKQNKRWPYESV